MSSFITTVLSTKRSDLTKLYAEVTAKVAELKKETSERVLVVRLGVDSAWDELKTAYETATARHPNEYSHSAKS